MTKPPAAPGCPARKVFALDLDLSDGLHGARDLVRSDAPVRFVVQDAAELASTTLMSPVMRPFAFALVHPPTWSQPSLVRNCEGATDAVCAPGALPCSHERNLIKK